MTARRHILPCLLTASLLGSASADVIFKGRVNYLVGPSGMDRSIAAHDMNADGWADFVAVRERTGDVVVRLSNGAGGSFPYESSRRISGATTQAVAVGDLDGDGDPDIAAACHGNGGHGFVVIVTNDGSGATRVTLTESDRLGDGQFNSVVAVDLEQDGDLDLVAGAASGIVHVWENIDGAFVDFAIVDTGADIRSVAAADLNNDGLADIVTAADNLGTPGGSVLLHDGGGYTLGSVRGGANPRAVRLIDVDADGDLDVVMACAGIDDGAPAVTISHNLGGGVFDAPQRIETPHSPTSLEADDLDRDGTRDLVFSVCHGCADDSPNNGQSGLYFMLNDGAGGFDAPAWVGEAPGGVEYGGPTAVAIADFNNDGLPEPCSASRDGGGGNTHLVSVWKNATAANEFSCDDPGVSLELSPIPPYSGTASNVFPGGAVADGAGGAYLSWRYTTVGDAARAHIQRVTEDGGRLWGEHGRVIVDLPETERPKLFANDVGGVDAVVMIRDGFTAWEARVQRFSPFGEPAYPPEGLVLSSFACSNQVDDTSVSIASDGEGGYYIYYRRNGFPQEMWINRVSATGDPLWDDPCGRPVLRSGFVLLGYSVSQFPNGDLLLVASSDDREANDGFGLDVRAQRITPEGTPLWGEMGVLVSARQFDQFVADPVPDGEGGWLILWYQRGTDPDFADDSVWGARIDGDGNQLWTPGGEEVLPAGHFLTRVGTDWQGGAWIAFWRQGDGRDNYLQRIDNQNVAVFAEPLPIALAPDRQLGASMHTDPVAGATLVWADWRNGGFLEQDLYFQRVTPGGQLLEPPNGTPITLEPNHQSQDGFAWTEAAPGRFIIAWDSDIPSLKMFADSFPCENPCPADFNGDGGVNTLDVLAFLNAWVAGDSRADFNEDGSVSTLDMLAFLNAWAAGC